MVFFRFRTYLFLLGMFSMLGVSAQSTFLPQGSMDNIFLERLEIKTQKDTIFNFSFVKPYSRQLLMERLQFHLKEGRGMVWTKLDKSMVREVMMNNPEWLGDSLKAKFFVNAGQRVFYRSPAHLLMVDQPDFFLSVNPVLQLRVGREQMRDETVMMNARGFTARALIGKTIGVYTYVAETQERGPSFWRDWVVQYRAVPGAGLYKTFKRTGYDYLDARGGVSFAVARHIQLQFGYDRMFLGNGYRSLFISDFSNNHLFLNLNMRVWRLNYVARTMQLTSQYSRNPMRDEPYPRKYMALRHISFNAPKWLTIGLFEAIVFGKTNDFQFAYLNPVIFLRPVELDMGSADNALLGVDVKANIARRVQLYGQLNMDEFNLRYLRMNKGWWANKWGLQLGGKYIDAFGVDHLDLQAEVNWIRPFTFTHNDTVANYTHYNQPLAHPLMANIREMIGVVRYQPADKWMINGRMIVWKQGTDTANRNFGNNIFLDADTRFMNEGFRIGSAVPRYGVNASLWISYAWKPNFFIEANVLRRSLTGKVGSTTASLGIRWNMHRREYDY